MRFITISASVFKGPFSNSSNRPANAGASDAANAINSEMMDAVRATWRTETPADIRGRERALDDLADTIERCEDSRRQWLYIDQEEYELPDDDEDDYDDDPTGQGRVIRRWAGLVRDGRYVDFSDLAASEQLDLVQEHGEVLPLIANPAPEVQLYAIERGLFDQVQNPDSNLKAAYDVTRALGLDHTSPGFAEAFTAARDGLDDAPQVVQTASLPGLENLDRPVQTPGYDY